MIKYKEKIIYTVYFLLVFGFLLTVFLKIHPLVLFNSDDWLYASYDRMGIPLWGEWNPCRVLPENLMSWCTYFCTYVLMPIFHLEFMDSIIIGYGIIYSIFIFIYFFLFVLFLKKKMKLSLYRIIGISLIFFILHFMALLRYLSGDAKNQHMFMALYTTCYFYYAIPNLWNSGMVFFFLFSDIHSYIRKRRYVVISILCLTTYLAIFSDLFQTIILISFMSYRILTDFIEQCRKHKKQIFRNVYETFRNTVFYCCGIAVWLVSLIFEYNGGRSEMISEERWIDVLSNSVRTYFGFFKNNLSKLFIVSFAGALIVAIVVFLINRKKTTAFDKSCCRYVLCFTYCFVVTSLFEILVCTKTGVNYLGRIDVMFGCMLYLILIFIVMLIYILHHIPFSGIFVPLYIYFIVSFSVFFSHNYYVTSSDQVDYRICKEISNSIVHQIMEADKKSQKEVTVYVPYFVGENNYPINTVPYGYTTFSYAYIVSDTLYKCDVIHKPIVITIQPDKKLNQKFHLT